MGRYGYEGTLFILSTFSIDLAPRFTDAPSEIELFPYVNIVSASFRAQRDDAVRV